MIICEKVGNEKIRVRSVWPLWPPKSLLFVLVALCMVATRANATPLFVNTTLLASGEPDPTGGVIIDTQTQPFASPSFTGSLISRVIAGDPSNLDGGLTFEYQLSNDLSSLHSMERVTINGFEGRLTDASYQIPTLNRPPTFDDRDATGNVVGFTFSNPIVLGPPLGTIGFGVLNPGQTSAWLVIQTDAPNYQVTSASVIDGFTASVPSFSPQVPEPATFTLACLAAAACVAIAVRKRSRV